MDRHRPDAVTPLHTGYSWPTHGGRALPDDRFTATVITAPCRGEVVALPSSTYDIATGDDLAVGVAVETYAERPIMV
jgi:hypothetical protein